MRIFAGLLKCSAGQRLSARNALEVPGWEWVRVVFPEDLEGEVWRRDVGGEGLGLGEMMRRFL